MWPRSVFALDEVAAWYPSLVLSVSSRDFLDPMAALSVVLRRFRSISDHMLGFLLLVFPSAHQLHQLAMHGRPLVLG